MVLSKNNRIDLLIEIYDQGYNKRAWHGTNLSGSLKGLKLPELLYRPHPKRHNIWEITLHCAYWKYVVLRRIVAGEKGSFPRKPSNFPALPNDKTLKNWKVDLDLLDEYHFKLRDVMAAFPESKLYKAPKNSKVSYIQTLYGISSHDLYHAGQIQLLKKMSRQKN